VDPALPLITKRYRYRSVHRRGPGSLSYLGADIREEGRHGEAVAEECHAEGR
jgi:hypothetical protein